MKWGDFALRLNNSNWCQRVGREFMQYSLSQRERAGDRRNEREWIERARFFLQEVDFYLKASATEREKMPFRRNVSVVGELVYWEYFKKTMRQLGTVPKVMLANSTNIKQAGFGSQVALHVNALYLAAMKMILPKYDALQAKNDYGESDKDRGKFSISNMPNCQQLSLY